jgi:DNA mismatch endonuclease (patch repair protein)
MARIRGADTLPEVHLRRALRSAGVQFRSNVKTSIARVDIVARVGPVRVAIFIDGCFWHGCPDHYVPPRSRAEFWALKLASNVARDRRQTTELEAEGWRVVRLWEHEVFDSLHGAIKKVGKNLGARRPNRSTSFRVFHVEWLDPERVLERRFLTDLRDPQKVEIVERRRQTGKSRAPAPARSRR